MSNEPKLACVIDRNSLYVDLVLVNIVPDIQGDGTHEEPYCYHLKDGESLVYTQHPHIREHAGIYGFVKPKWSGSAWVEAASETEIAAWELEHPAPEPLGPIPQEDSDALLIDHEYRLTLLELGVN